MVLEIFTGLFHTDITYLLLILGMFVTFIFLMKKVMKTIITVIWIAFASLAFPFVMNSFFGMSIPMDLNSVIFFVTLGVGMYFIYIFAKIIYTVLGFAEKGAKAAAYPITYRSNKKKRDVEKKMGEFIKDQERLKKEKS